MKEIIITYLASYLVVIIACSIYTMLGFTNLDGFIEGPCSYLILVFYIIVIFYLYFKHRRVERKLKFKRYFLFLSYGISIAILFNMILFKFSSHANYSTIPIYLSFISSGIVGPIYEEILFRYIFYHRLKKKYSRNKAIIINTLLFGMIHLYPIKIIYAMILGISLTVIYEKEKSILAPILVHIGANSIVLLLYQFHPTILILAIINLIINSYLIFSS